jgi:acylphosphatase
MKLQITIIGPKVHDVGYRYFLMSMAMAQRIRMFEAHNLESVMGEVVLVLVDGGEQEIKAFRALVETKRPERAEVSKVAIDDFGGEVMKIGEYAQFCATVQMNKAIPLLRSMNDSLLSMNDKIDAIVRGQEDTTEETRGLRDDLAIRNNIEWQKRMEKDIRIIKGKMGIR